VKTALITGAKGGIGQALCSAFHTAGYWVLASDIATGEDLGDQYLPLDLIRFCQEDTYRQESLAQISALLGEHGLTALVNNAAVQILHPTSAFQTKDWYQTLEVNLLAPFFLTQGLLPHLKQAQGSVVNIASIHGTLTKPGFVAYATSKAALVGMTRSLAVDLGPEVRVNAISPAAVATPMLMAGFAGNAAALQTLEVMHPVGRIADPEEVAQAAIFLASPQAQFMSGSELCLDGGIRGRLHDPV
jgi:NAD(P)-dependent dehydrogenase (short-subunit alcohol dehydrogenase family)